ncbi:hypothetical protein M2459_002750 [Parabacteroides sp. PF5-5]|uniref:hypothetical protein n=1 Tax=unclassified Parabacteroides TaxID=2649774 RepID=UPI0024753C82|nr:MULTISPECIES: hypothetical protein [unclassified Parabacteroides]MDH6306106.1 hypothetical protein [Parabacteroides sp. PH5-39]MDH6316996.1 hypothetical protein [Parabacteroides sp. PF5-13]MDH6320749.1 hypothetical protein [Parabacteroides sp. PH5-13]MDH6324549.1 hypothetical protein [Parabacteroides sp. PH5-8]MDH6328181.1 hypothetical protein [Parabacteroides sp. PH5-41]
MKVTLKILLVAAVLLLTYMCYRSIKTPMEFDAEKETREKAIISRLIDIRKAQLEYKNVYKEHAGSFDDLIKFLDEKKLPFLNKVGVLTDEQLEKGMTEQEAVKKGLIKRDTFWVLAKDTLFSPTYNSADLRYVPGTQKQFNMDTATLTSGAGYTIKVFEANVNYNDYLGDLDKQLLLNLEDKAEKQSKFPGLRVGSLTEINNNAGNWE